MTIIWRGAGIIVPLAFVGAGALASLWFDDATLGNLSYIGWVCLGTAAISLVVGLATFPGKKKDPATGILVSKKKHDFFFLPIIIWAIVFAGLSIFLLCGFSGFSAQSTSEKLTYKDMAGLPRTQRRVVHFYNPTRDTLRYVFVNTQLMADSKWLAPGQQDVIGLPVELYQFVSFDQSKKERYTKLPLAENAADTLRYITYKDVDGTEKKLRSVKGATVDYNDYDEAWLLLDPTYSILLVNVTELSQAKNKITEDKVKSINWEKRIYGDYNGNDLIEPYIKGVIREEMLHRANVTVVTPEEKIPVRLSENSDVYVLVPYPTGKKPNNEMIISQIIRSGFDE